MWISRRKVRFSVVAVLLATALGLAVPPAAVAQPDAAGRAQLFSPAQAFTWLADLWQEVSSLWRGGALDKSGVTEGGELPPDDGNTTNGGDEGPAIDPNGG